MHRQLESCAAANDERDPTNVAVVTHLKSREGVGLSGRGRGAGRVCAEECEDSDEHEKRRGNGAKDRAGQSPRLRFGGHLHDVLGFVLTREDLRCTSKTPMRRMQLPCAG